MFHQLVLHKVSCNSAQPWLTGGNAGAFPLDPAVIRRSARTVKSMVGQRQGRGRAGQSSNRGEVGGSSPGEGWIGGTSTS